MSFRNYTPVNESLKDQESKVTTVADIGDTVEKKMEGVVEKVIQEEDEKRAKDVVSTPPPLPVCFLSLFHQKTIHI